MVADHGGSRFRGVPAPRRRALRWARTHHGQSCMAEETVAFTARGELNGQHLVCPRVRSHGPNLGNAACAWSHAAAPLRGAGDQPVAC